MFWNSIPLMTAFGLVIAAMTLWSIVAAFRYRTTLSELRVFPAVAIMVLGLLIIAAHYLADLFTMTLLPRLVGGDSAMAAMRVLHLNWSWPVVLLGVTVMVAGLLYMLTKLLPRIAAIVRAQQSEIERRTAAERSLDESRLQLQELVDALPILISYVDKDQRWRLNNKAYMDWTGRSPDELTGIHIRDGLGEKAYERILPYVERALAGEAVVYEVNTSLPYGGTRHFRAIYVPHIGSNGVVEGFFSTVADISELKQAQHALAEARDKLEQRIEERTAELQQANTALRESEARFRTFMEHSPTLIVSKDTEGRFLMANERTCEILGHSEEELLGKTMHDLVPKAFAEAFAEHDRQVLDSGQAIAQELPTPTAEGPRYFHEVKFPIFDASGVTIGIGANCIDVTARRLAEEQARIANSQLDEAIEAISEGFLLVDAEDRILRYNSRFLELYPGISDQLVPGLAFAEWVRLCAYSGQFAEAIGREDDWIAERMDAARAPGGPKDFRFADGRWVQVLEYKTPSGYTAGLRLDITERKRAEEALRESEARFRDFAESASDWFWEMDADLRFTNIAGRYEEITGESPTNYIGHTRRELLETSVITLTDEQIAMTEANIRDLEAHRPCRDFEITWHRADGTLGTYANSGKPIFDEDGAFKGYRGTGRDITERKRAEEALRESDRKYLEMFNRAQVGLARTRISDHKVLEANDRLAEIYGYDNRAEFLAEVVPAEHWADRTARHEMLAEGLRTGGVRDLEARHTRKDGTAIWIRLSTRYFPELDYFETSNVDITELKDAERALQTLNEELEQRVVERTAELRAAQEELVRKERLATLGQLTATVSHELRNPLGAMRNSIHVLRKSADLSDDMPRRAIERVERGIGRCDAIIDELLDFARIQKLERQAVELDAWLAALLDEQPIPDGVVLDRRLALPATVMSIDPDRLRRAVINVFENACQAMADGAPRRLTVATRAGVERIEISLADTGPGIAAEIRDKIFEPLFSTKNFGVGLGLPTVKQIMQQHGGGIEVETGEGRGACFVLWLPRKGLEGVDPS